MAGSFCGLHTPGQIAPSPIMGGHTVYSLDPGGTLYAFDTETGLAYTALDRHCGPILCHTNALAGAHQCWYVDG